MVESHNLPENEIAEVILIIKKRADNFKQKINELKEAMALHFAWDDI